LGGVSWEGGGFVGGVFGVGVDGVSVEEAAEGVGSVVLVEGVGAGVDGTELDVALAGFEVEDGGGLGGGEGGVGGADEGA
jgi:hypothetical protein